MKKHGTRSKLIKPLVITDDSIINKIYFIRGQKIMLDRDLAILYGVETKVLNQAVKRNLSRFPEDFMFRLTEREIKSLRSQIVTSKKGRGGRRYSPVAFTEQGVAMLSSILKSETAIGVNIQIIRVFTRMKQMLLSNKDVLLQLEKIEKKLNTRNKDIQLIFKYLRQLLNPLQQTRKRIDFKITTHA